jgi:hypothetical protein
MHGGLSLRSATSQPSVLRMKNLKSLQVVALAGVAVALTAGCSSTSSTRADYNSSDENAAYRYASAGGWVPITSAYKNAVFPFGWTPGDFGPVSYETYVFTPPTGEMASGSAAVSTSGSASTTISTDGSSTTIASDRPATTTIATDGSDTTITTTSASAQFNENLQPGDTFVEAAGANSDSPKVRRVILYSPFGSTGVGN